MPNPPNIEAQTFAGASTKYTGSAGALNDLLFDSTDVSNYQWWSLALVGSSHIGRLTWQCSQDHFTSDPVGMYAYQIGVPSAYYLNATDVGSQTQIFHGPKFADCMRVIMDAYTSGSVTAILSLYANSNYPGTINAIQTGLWALGTSPASNSNGSVCFPLISANTDNATNIKNSHGQVYGYDIYNTHATLVRYVKLYNKSSTPAPASDASLLKRTIAVPPSGRAYHHSVVGLAGFGNGIGMAAVTGSATNDDTAVGAGDLIINIDYSAN